MPHLLDNVLQAQKRGQATGIPSLCSAHPWVLKTALCSNDFGRSGMLIEATCNQVNQFGGYTGMTPADFVRYVRGIAAENGFPLENILLGGDHLGPSPWQDGPTARAMSRAEDMVQAYVRAGFTKIHLDASMKLGDDDPSRPLDLELAARRTAWLAKAAEAAADPETAPRYIIGTEVPIPGGATSHEDGVSVTTVEDAQRTLEVTHAAFVQAGLELAWERVVAVVVQPGVEFGDDFILEYQHESARELSDLIEKESHLVYEAHSTDYQTRSALKNMVEDHFAILKVGPALTFAFREAVFALSAIESELFSADLRANVPQALENAAMRRPEYWIKYYQGTAEEQAFKRKYSLSDRLRYYWTSLEVQAALTRLLQNFGDKPIPIPLISQYLPEQYVRIRSGELPNRVESILMGRIQNVLADYHFACTI